MARPSLKMLITVQDVTLQGVVYPDAVLQWIIDEHYDFSTASGSLLTSMGVISPTAVQTGGVSVTDLEIFAKGVGAIAGGDIDAATGELRAVSVLVSSTCS